MRFSVVLLCLVLSACATTVDKQYATLELARTCCATVAEFDFVPLRAKGEKFNLDARSPVFDFATGRSYFKAFELPPGSPRRFRIKSYFNGMMIGQYLDPLFIVLDERFEPIGMGALPLRFEDGNLFGDQNARMLGFFQVDASARYLVVLTAAFDSQAPVAQTKPSVSVAMIGPTPVASPSPGISIPLHRSPTGTLRLEPVK